MECMSYRLRLQLSTSPAVSTPLPALAGFACKHSRRVEGLGGALKGQFHQPPAEHPTYPLSFTRNTDTSVRPKKPCCNVQQRGCTGRL